MGASMRRVEVPPIRAQRSVHAREGRSPRGSAPEARATTAVSGTWSVVGSSATALATTVLLVIPALMELAAAHWNSSYAYAIAQLVPPTTLATRTLAPLLPGVAIGVLVTLPMTYVLLRPRRSTSEPKVVTRYRLVCTRRWLAMTRDTRPPFLFPWVAPVLGGAAVTFLGLTTVGFAGLRSPSLSIYLTALVAGLVVLTVSMLAADRRDHRTLSVVPVAYSCFAAVAVVTLVLTVNPFPWATFQLANSEDSVTGRLLDTTDTGVWLLTDDGRPAFYTGPLDGLTICDAETHKRARPACSP